MGRDARDGGTVSGKEAADGQGRKHAVRVHHLDAGVDEHGAQLTDPPQAGRGDIANHRRLDRMNRDTGNGGRTRRRREEVHGMTAVRERAGEAGDLTFNAANPRWAPVADEGNREGIEDRPAPGGLASA